METKLEKISKFSAEEIIEFLSSQLINYFRFKQPKKQLKICRSVTGINAAKAHRIRPCSRDRIDATKQKQDHDNNAFRLTLNKIPQGKSNPYEIETSLMIHNIFSKIGENYAGNIWLRDNVFKEYNTFVIKQFFLDCFVYDQNFMNILMVPTFHVRGVTVETFSKCFDQMKNGHLQISSAYNRVDKLKRNNFHIQKVLCKKYLVFYSVVNFHTGDDLDKEGLTKALGIIEWRSKIQLENYVENIMSRLAFMHNKPVHKISFNDFYKIILSMDL
ncbi:hypothetical protein SteCoe_19054 [Stentor coeruleus]|uniref:Uncharacterized protein n=1 Tax=Stentor coeruleus TaxID=5963 RepID=A0A1R2BVL2_9CILI|nr:hypothetical protein SteCoe_19054 [Stentor coeruleus]